MKKNQAETKSPNDLAIEFFTEIIPHYAADPEWRNIFNEFCTLSEEERVGMLQRLETAIIPPRLVSEEQLSMGLAFLRLNLEDPVVPRMMVKMIDYENFRVQKILFDKEREVANHV